MLDYHVSSNYESSGKAVAKKIWGIFRNFSYDYWQ
jgi:hypothetical protein